MLQVSTSPNELADGYARHAASPVASDPVAIRLAAVHMVAGNQTAQAVALVSAGLAAHPDSEDLLVMRALISEMRHDWDDAIEALERLLRVQGQSAPAETWCHWVRSLRCGGQWRRALEAATQALDLFSGHPMLVSEWQTLNSVLRSPRNSSAA
jgi:hypothetical protein